MSTGSCILDSDSGNYKKYDFLGCNAVQFGRYRFRETHLLHVQARKLSQARKK
jgi:hypothetical protein